MSVNRKGRTGLIDQGQEAGQHRHGSAPPSQGAARPTDARQVVIVTVVTAVAAVLTFVRRVEVHGESMLPVLRPGDRLLVLRASRARPGQLVVFGDPRRRGRTLVKRVVTTTRRGGRAEVAGDNSASSTDSTVFGPVRVTGRVVYRYHPPGRVGRVS